MESLLVQGERVPSAGKIGEVFEDSVALKVLRGTSHYVFGVRGVRLDRRRVLGSKALEIQPEASAGRVGFFIHPFCRA